MLAYYLCKCSVGYAGSIKPLYEYHGPKRASRQVWNHVLNCVRSLHFSGVGNLTVSKANNPSSLFYLVSTGPLAGIQ